LSPRDAKPAPIADEALLDALPRLPRDAEGPVFAEPWQAQAFALAVDLSRAGHFTWPEWAAELGRVLAEAAASGTPDDGAAYWTHWQTALERLVLARGLSTTKALDARTEAWREAYRTTPHGQPVTLSPSRS
jgi:nitrile hydratase accessory protein